jgi:hypothetical protein
MLLSSAQFFNRCAMPAISLLALSCPQCERFEAEFREARERLLHMRLAAAIGERRLADSVAMAIARAKEHRRSHGREGCEKGVATK